MKRRKNLLVFTDLDGTLLDHNTYSFNKALPALKELKKRRIPLILCSSKTRVEMEEYSKKLGIRHPFIFENGGAIFIPSGYFSGKLKGLKKVDGYQVHELGTPYQRLREIFLKTMQEFNLRARGFGDMSAKEIASLCNLTLKQAKLAKKREYNEPFYFAKRVDSKTVGALKKRFASQRLNLTRGGRFYHLTGKNDKGKAVSILIRWYKREHPKGIFTVGVGDSLNDLPLLEAVEFPILVKKPAGRYENMIKKKLNPFLAKGIGPQGWNRAILEVIDKYS